VFTRNSLAVRLCRRTFFLAVLTVSAALNIAASPATNPVPIITFLSPISANPGGAGFTLTVNGANFVNAVSVVNWNGTPLATTFTNPATLTAAVTSAQIESGGTGWITVFNPGCAGECNRTSNVFYFPVTNPISTYDAVELTAPVGSGPISLSEGDFNGDGKLDLAVSNYEGSSVSILLGNGDGTFQPQATLGTLSEPFGSAVGDINGDGIPDLVVGNDLESGGLNIFLGDGSGGFTSGTALEGGDCLMEPVLADINGDGYLDIVVGNYCGSGIEVFLGNGDGTFGAPSVIGTGAVLGLVVADFNGDGILDLAAANYGNGLLGIYLGVGDGTFGSVSPIVLPDVFQVVAGDVNGDGEVDLITASESSGINLLYGNGDGTFQAAVLAASGGYLALAAGDLSGNGSLDITAIGTSASVKVLFANGEGTYQAPKVVGSAFSYGIALGNFATAGGLDVAVANLDADQADIFLPTVVISPSSKNFGSVSVGGGSAQQIFTVTNDSPSTVTISTITFTGADPEDFSQSNTCSTALATAGTCTVTVTFAPAAAGARAATLTLTDDAPTTPQIALLTGTGTATPLATLSTTSLNFGSQTLHVTSASQPMTLTNTGTASLTGIVISVTGTNNSDFGLITNCDATLTASSLCTVNVTFTPSVAGTESAALEFSDNAANTPQLVQLSGTGLDVATNLNYVQAPPASLLAGSSIGNISVGVYDANSVLVTASSASVTVTITGPNSFSQSQTVAASAGIASFNFGSVPLDVAGQYTETAFSSGLVSAISTTMVTPLLSSEQMVVAGFPSPTYANVSHPFAISVTDSFGNPISSYAGTVTLASSDPGAILTPTTYTFVGADMGAHIFTANLVTVGAQTISASDGTLSGSEAGIVVSPRPQLVANLLPDDAGAASACDGSESCSLRSAIHVANTLGAGDITVDTSQFTGSAPWTSILMNGPLELNSTVNLTGPGQIGIGSGAGQNQLSLSGNNLSSVFQVDAGAIASISGLSATLGSSSGNGGGISNAGSLTLTNVTVSDSMAAEEGGGIYSSGSLTVNSSTLSGNTAGANGGGAATAGASVFYDSTIAGNMASGVGGGIANSGALSMPQSTVYGNTAVDGAGIENETAGTLVMAQSTVSGNIASSDSGGTVTNQSEAQGAVTILNSIVAGNTAPNGDCVNCRLQVSFNVFEVAAATLMLGPLTNNGGFTKTLLPLAGSPAIGGGSVALATNSGLPESLANDQRGTGYLRIVNNSVDLGSIQYNSGPASSFVLVVTGSPVTGNALTLTLHSLTAGGNPDGAYAGTVEFTSSDPHAALPANYAFVPSDNGTHVFTVTLQTSGSQTMVATDVANSSLQATQTVVVSPAAATTIVVSAGSGQTAPVEAAFVTALSAKVSDGFGNGVPGATVSFSAPSSGASGTFAGGALGASVVSGSNGVATAPVFTANAVTGRYSVVAAVTGLTTTTFALTNAALSAASMTLAAAGSAVAGSPLNVTASALTANATADMSYAGTIHFTSTDAQAVLPADYTYVPSDAGAHVFSLTLKTSGSQSVTATDTVNSALHATQTVVESPAAAATIAASAGSGQTALEEAAFATALAAKVSDSFGNFVPGTTVIFSAPSFSTPSSGAGGTFAGGGSSASVTTGGTGIATAPAFTANGTAGAYSVSAGVQGLTSVTFALTNAAPIIVQPPDYSITVAPAALTIVEGQSGSTVVTLTPVGGMTGTAAFTCTGLPAKAACVFAPVQVVMSGNDAVQTVTLTVNTTGTNGVIAGIHPASFPWNAAGMLAFLAMPAGLLFLVIPGSIIPRLIIPGLIIPGSVRKGSIRNGRNRQGYVRLWLVLLLGSFTAIGMTSCGGVSSSGGGTEAATPPGQYSISAAASVTGATGHSALVTITVTQ
jgi:hypothetical protein